MKSLWKLKPYLKPHWRWIAVSLVLAIPMAAIRFSPVVLIQKLIDDLLATKDQSKLVTFPLMVIGIFAVNFVVRFIHYSAIRVVVARVNQKLKNDLYDHVMGLSADYFTTASTGNLMSRVGNDPNQIDQGIAQFAVMLREPFQLVFLLGYTFYMNWKLTLVTIAVFPPLALVFSYSGKALKRYIHRLQEEQARMFATLQESFTGVRVIKSFRLEEYVRKKYYERSEAFFKNLSKTIIVEETSHPLVEFIMAFAIAGLIYLGGKAVLENSMTQGQLLAFFGAFAMMQNPIRVLNDMNIKLNNAGAAAERVFEIMDWRTRLLEKPNAAEKHGFTAEIRLSNVRFAYPDAPDREVLKGISFAIPKGRSLALVGASGAGKSSLVSLLPRIFDVTDGKIEIDGIDVRDLKLDDLRSLISVVSQDVFLFHDTIAENIRCGRLGATDEEVRQAAREAFATDFIDRLPDGFMTNIGDRGQKLSGGERQRLSIARAFLRNSPILILDEATSALDNASEKAVQAALDKLMRDKTTILIAHRLSTIRNANRILVMREGSVVEDGTHGELVTKDGEYAAFLKIAEHRA
ncbi:MAG: ABC transporter ATP-binding protein [Bdellovibrionales bacterium]|nr:ABC transporter ATP-binding protein [Bdellovibrionales bacterium]